MKLAPGDLALVVAMIAVPLLLGVGAAIGAVIFYPKEQGGESQRGGKVLATLLGCLGLLLVVAGLGMGACWGYVMLD